jgi:hypothetical protein
MEAITARRVRDPYADLLRDSRGMRKELSSAREAWFAALTLERKEDVLFELETLLKSVVAWSNPRNHPRRASSLRAADREFHPHTLVTRAAVARALALCNQLLGAQSTGVALGRQLPSGFRDEPLPAETPAAPATAEGPQEALRSLRGALGVHLEILDGVARGGMVPYRLFYATAHALQRELSRNVYFNPLQVLEFRPEFDRVRAPEVLDAIQSVDGEVPHRLVALTFLSHFRLLRLAQLVQHTAADPTASRRAYAILAVIHAEQRALAEALQGRAGAMLADTLERDILKVTAMDLKGRYDALTRECERLQRLRVVLVSSAAALRAEARRALTMRVPPCDDPTAQQDLGAQCAVVAQRLREAAQVNMLHLTATLRGSADPERIFAERGARRTAGERARQSAWMFQIVLRAFVAKAKLRPADDVDRWSWTPASAFIEDFLGHFERMGRTLAVESEYPQTDRMTHALLALREKDYVMPTQLTAAAVECETFGAWLRDHVEKVGRREELRALPLDRGAAAETLRAHVAPIG